MKKTRKLFALLLTVAMVFSMATAVFAAGETDGTIIIEEATVDEMYKVYDDSGKFLCVSKEQTGLLKMVKCFFG